MFDRFITAEQRRRSLFKKAPQGPLKDFLSQPFTSNAEKLADVEFLALDLEATGLDYARDEILSVGFTTIRNMSIQLSDCQYHIVRPEQDIPEKTAIVHKILDDESAKGIELEQALAIILDALKGKVMLAHHSCIECNFINNACKKVYRSEIVFPIVDTYTIEYKSLKHRGITPENKGLRLYKLREDYGLPRYPAHNALNDAIAAGELFLAQVAHRQGKSAMTLKEVIARC